MRPDPSVKRTGTGRPSLALISFWAKPAPPLRAAQLKRQASVNTAAVALSLLLAGVVAHAEGLAPPTPPFDAQTWPSSISRRPITGANLGVLRLEFEKITLPDVLSRADVGSIQHSGDAGESIYWLCYTVSGTKPTRLWLTSHGEMGGPEHALSCVTIVALKSSQPVSDCPALPAHMRPISLLGGPVRVGAEMRSLSKKLGPPSHRSGAWVSYNFAGKATGNCPGGFNVLNSLVLKVERGTVKAIHSNQVTSC